MGKLILGIDPGPKDSAYVVIKPEDLSIVDKGHVGNKKMRDILFDYTANSPYTRVACEGIQSYGMPVGRETFDTCYWIGRFWEIVIAPFSIVYRADIKLHLCMDSRAKDKNIRQALLDRYKPTGGGKNPKIGIKKNPGPLFGVANHAWSALAVAVFYAETMMPSEYDLGEFSFGGDE